MNKWHKWIAYGAIVVFVVLFMTGIGLLVIKPFNDRAKAYIKQTTKQAKEYKAEADSLEGVIIYRTDSLITDKVADSVLHVTEKKKLLQKFKQKEKNHEAKIAAIDTIHSDSLHRHGSTRELLSDSACNLR